jgi:cell wall integrity and stress response component
LTYLSLTNKIFNQQYHTKMTLSLLRAVALSAAFALITSPAAAQTATQPVGAIQTLGCYDDAGSLTEFGDAIYQTSGYCQSNCTGLEKPVMAIIGGSTCFCGDELPAKNHEVDDSKCNSICMGFGEQTCGGLGYFRLYLTGLTANVKTAPNDTTSSAPSASSAATSTQAIVATKPAATVFVTNPSSSEPTQKSSGGGGGPNKVAIAVGVVVGVIAIAAIIGVIVFIMRRRRNQEIEEEHRRNAAASSLSAKSDTSSKDQRLDPSIYSHRRQSIGSIADERDFSRRILQV